MSRDLPENRCDDLARYAVYFWPGRIGEPVVVYLRCRREPDHGGSHRFLTIRKWDRVHSAGRIREHDDAA